MRIPNKRGNIITNLSQMVFNKQINGVELILSAKNSENDIKDLDWLFLKHHIPVLSIHQPILQILNIDIPSIEFLFKAAKILGAKVIAVHLYAMKKLLENPKNIEYLKKLEKKYQINIGYENSSRDIGIGLFSKVAKKFAWEENEFTNKTEQLGIKVTFDTTHLGLSKWGINKFYLNNKNKIINIHLSDYKNGLLSSHLPLGKGYLPIRDFLINLKKQQYRGLITLEVNADFCELTNNISFVRSLIS